MIKISLPDITSPQLKRAVLILLPLGFLHAGVWYYHQRLIEGRQIALTLASITGINLVLLALTFHRFPRLAAMILLSTYFLHVLYFVLLVLAMRGV